MLPATPEYPSLALRGAHSEGDFWSQPTVVQGSSKSLIDTTVFKVAREFALATEISIKVKA